MVYVHGGAFVMGGGASYFFGPNYIIEHDVLLVTFNYRLGAFGFLATDDKASAGNMALLDQIMALKWVQKNIEKFGGDPSQVPIL
jgi:carboxylesterase type B